MDADPIRDSRRVTMDATTTASVAVPTRSCPICAATFTPVGRRRYCSERCRARAYRRRRAAQVPEPPPPPPGGVRARSVYECPECGERHLGEQRCPDCGVFCSRVGLGGACPHCDEPVAVADLIDPTP